MDDISLLLPAFNEERAIGTVIDVALSERISLQNILVGDNNSTDRTKAIATRKGVKVISVRKQGKGAVIRELVNHIDTPYAMVADSDLTYPLFRNVSRIRGLLQRYEAVMTYRKPVGGAMSTVHKFGNNCLSLFASYMFGMRIYDVVSGMWGFRTDSVRKIIIDDAGFTPDVDFITGMIKSGASIAQIPISYYPRPNGSHTKLNMGHGLVIAAQIIKRRIV